MGEKKKEEKMGMSTITQQQPSKKRKEDFSEIGRASCRERV